MMLNSKMKKNLEEVLFLDMLPVGLADVWVDSMAF